jgi:squalene-associated FAD-dependent desaturase
MAAAARADQAAAHTALLDRSVSQHLVTPGQIHVIGAGLAGLSAAVRLASRGLSVAIHEATNQAGGRCRSYYDSTFGMEIDNGNHLLLSGNAAALSYLDVIGARAELSSPPSASFPFVDLATGERWTVRANDGIIPWWILDPARRVPGARLHEYLALAKLLRARAGATIGETISCSGPLYARLIEPLLISALNTEARNGSATLAAAIIRQTLAAGGRSYRPLIARNGLSNAFVKPALQYVAAHGGSVNFGRRLRRLAFAANRVSALDFGDTCIPVRPTDAVVFAASPTVAESLVPDLPTPAEFRAIVNAHFRVEPPAGLAPMIGVLNGMTQWLFAFPGRLSVTISAADDLLELSREDLAHRIWREVAVIANLADAKPVWQIVRERRATFAATPREDAKRPVAATAWENLVLAGDWTQTGLPATIEGAIRSGAKAAEILAPR